MDNSDDDIVFVSHTQKFGIDWAPLHRRLPLSPFFVPSTSSSIHYLCQCTTDRRIALGIISIEATFSSRVASTFFFGSPSNGTFFAVHSILSMSIEFVPTFTSFTWMQIAFYLNFNSTNQAQKINGLILCVADGSAMRCRWCTYKFRAATSTHPTLLEHLVSPSSPPLSRFDLFLLSQMAHEKYWKNHLQSEYGLLCSRRLLAMTEALIACDSNQDKNVPRHSPMRRQWKSRQSAVDCSQTCFCMCAH